MSEPRTGLEQARLRGLLLDAAKEEQRLHRRARTEREAQHRWEQRAALATERLLPDLAAAARERAKGHAARTASLERELEQQRTWVEQLRDIVRFPLVRTRRLANAVERAPLPRAVAADWKLNKEAGLDQDLRELKQRLSATRRGAELSRERM